MSAALVVANINAKIEERDEAGNFAIGTPEKTQLGERTTSRMVIADDD